MDLFKDIWVAIGSALTGFESRLAIFYICCSVVIAYAIWMFRGRSSSFLRFLLPREIYLHRSNIVDIQLFLLNLVLGAVGFFGTVLFIPVVANFVLNQLVSLQDAPFQPLAMSWGRSAAATLIIILVADFCKYCTHYIHHENKILWPFHSVHHSAEVMTPVTVSRNHPLYLVIRNIIISFGLGTAQALALFLLIGKIDLLTIGGANAGYFLFNLFGANLRHSHIWLSYGRVLEHIFISPAQHQIHHSRAKKHFNKNYGEVFAIWDWMFGTLYIPKDHEELEFGLADATGTPIDQPHGTLKDALFRPFVESFQEAAGIEFKAAPQDASIQRK